MLVRYVLSSLSQNSQCTRYVTAWYITLCPQCKLIHIVSFTLSPSSSSLYIPSTNLDMSDDYTGLTHQEWRECVLYKNTLRSSIRGVGHHPARGPPPFWREYLAESARYEDQATHIRHAEAPVYSNQYAYQPPPIPANTVSLPAEALNVIIRAIRNRNPALPPRTSMVNHYIPRPPPSNNNRGRSTY